MSNHSFASFLVKDAVSLLILATLAYSLIVFGYGLISLELGPAAYGACVAWLFIRALGLHHANWNDREKRGSVPNYRLMAYAVSLGLMAVYAAVWIHHSI